MKVDSIKYSYCKQTNFQGNKINTIVEKLSMRDFYKSQEATEFRELRTIYDNLYKKLSLPENLKPRLQYQAMIAEMSFSIHNYTINVNKHLSPFRMNVRNKTGYSEANLRHEIEHLKQIWDIIRLLGADNTAKLFDDKDICEVKHSLLKKMKDIEKTLGRISSDSKEGKDALQYIDALVNYPKMDRYYGEISIKNIIILLKYQNNILEKKARLSAKEYMPTFFKQIKITFQEFIKLIKKK